MLQLKALIPSIAISNRANSKAGRPTRCRIGDLGRHFIALRSISQKMCFLQSCATIVRAHEAGGLVAVKLLLQSAVTMLPPKDRSGLLLGHPALRNGSKSKVAN